MSHNDLFNSLLSLQQPLLTSLSSPPSSSTRSKPPSKSKSKSQPKSKSTKCMDSDSDDSIMERKRPPSMQQRKRKYQDDVIIDGDTPLNKKLRRQQQNRQAAHTSRIKKKAQMDTLQQQVHDLMDANRMLQEKVAALTSEIAANRQILSSPCTSSIPTPSPHIMESPISHASCTEPSSPESPISPITSVHSPLSDSDSSMDTSSHSDSTTSQIPLIISEMAHSSEITPSSIITTPIVDMIPDSTRCYDPAAIELSPQCQRMENGITSNPNTHQQPPLTWPQFTLLICILHTLTCLIPSLKSPSHHQTNTLRLNPSICLTSPYPPTPPLSRIPNIPTNVDPSHVMSTTCTHTPPTPAHILCAMLLCAMMSSRGNLMTTPVS